MKTENYDISRLMKYLNGELQTAETEQIRQAMEHDPVLRCIVEGIQIDAEMNPEVPLTAYIQESMLAFEQQLKEQEIPTEGRLPEHHRASELPQSDFDKRNRRWRYADALLLLLLIFVVYVFRNRQPASQVDHSVWEEQVRKSSSRAGKEKNNMLPRLSIPEEEGAPKRLDKARPGPEEPREIPRPTVPVTPWMPAPPMNKTNSIDSSSFLMIKSPPSGPVASIIPSGMQLYAPGNPGLVGVPVTHAYKQSREKPIVKSVPTFLEDPFMPSAKDADASMALMATLHLRNESGKRRSVRLLGEIRDAGSDRPIEGVRIEVFVGNGVKPVYTSQTAEDGAFFVTLWKEDKNVLMLHRKGYHPKKVVPEVTSEDTKTFYRLYPIDSEKGLVTPPPVAEIAKDATHNKIVEGTPRTEKRVPANRPPSPLFETFFISEKTSLREAATHTSRSMLRLYPPYRVEVLEKSDRWWWKVRFDGLIGYVKARCLESERHLQ